MQRLALDDLRQNAFRVLGLTAAATQADIDAAARLLRLMNPADQAPQAGEWLGLLRRQPSDIEAAVVRLVDPRQRLGERIVWFFRVTPLTWDDTVALMNQALHHPDPPLELLHDALLVRLARLLVAGDNYGLELWSKLLADARDLVGSPLFAQWMDAAEQSGDFEKHATTDEIAAARSALPELILGTLAHRGQAALDGNDLGVVEKIAAVIDGAPELQWLLDRGEHTLENRCRVAHASIYDAWGQRDKQAMSAACRELMLDYRAELGRLMQFLLRRVGPGDVSQRIATSVARVLEYAAKALEAAYDFAAALEALELALQAAAGTSLARHLQEKRDALHQLLYRRDEFVFQKNVESQTRKLTSGQRQLLATVGAGVVVSAGAGANIAAGQSDANQPPAPRLTGTFSPFPVRRPNYRASRFSRIAILALALFFGMLKLMEWSSHTNLPPRSNNEPLWIPPPQPVDLPPLPTEAFPIHTHHEGPTPTIPFSLFPNATSRPTPTTRELLDKLLRSQTQPAHGPHN